MQHRGIISILALGTAFALSACGDDTATSAGTGGAGAAANATGGTATGTGGAATGAGGTATGAGGTATGTGGTATGTGGAATGTGGTATGTGGAATGTGGAETGTGGAATGTGGAETGTGGVQNTAGAGGAGTCTGNGFAQLVVPMDPALLTAVGEGGEGGGAGTAPAKQETDFEIDFGADGLVDLTGATITWRIRATTGAWGGVQFYVKNGEDQDYAGYYGGDDGTWKNFSDLSDWTDIVIDLSSVPAPADATSFDPAQVRYVGINLSSGDPDAEGTWEEVTIQVDSVTFSAGTTTRTFDSGLEDLAINEYNGDWWEKASLTQVCE